LLDARNTSGATVARPATGEPGRPIAITTPTTRDQDQHLEEPMGRALVITSGKGGVGKTTTTANLGAALAQRGFQVVLVDADIGLRNLDVVMGLENRIVYHLVDVVQGKCSAQKALIRDRRIEGLYLLPSSQTDEKDSVTPEQTRAVIAELKQTHDFVLIDCPAGIEQGFRNAVAGADEAIIVATPEVSSIRDADRVAGLLAGHDIPARLVVNRISPNLVKRGDMLSKDDVVDILALDLLGAIPLDDEIVASTNRGVPATLGGTSPAARAFDQITGALVGEPIEELVPQTGFFSRIGRALGLSPA
jgi:septum site-determining protein MinD